MNEHNALDNMADEYDRMQKVAMTNLARVMDLQRQLASTQAQLVEMFDLLMTVYKLEIGVGDDYLMRCAYCHGEWDKETPYDFRYTHESNCIFTLIYNCLIKYDQAKQTDNSNAV